MRPLNAKMLMAGGCNGVFYYWGFILCSFFEGDDVGGWGGLSCFSKSLVMENCVQMLSGAAGGCIRRRGGPVGDEGAMWQTLELIRWERDDDDDGQRRRRTLKPDSWFHMQQRKLFIHLPLSHRCVSTTNPE